MIAFGTLIVAILSFSQKK
ncbi:putative holin-like toxin [Aneurinibacillus migulanus]|nr:putative holin-like toxin [Aneurinibacillus aneurinilyticus]MCP1358765.1 putative holin-like toxin [Aneurinibacillus migulanus]